MQLITESHARDMSSETTALAPANGKVDSNNDDVDQQPTTELVTRGSQPQRHNNIKYAANTPSTTTNAQSSSLDNIFGKQVADTGAGETSAITNFYKGKNILITGVTGFLGKVLLWKLHDTCPDAGKIYVLTRPKNTATAEKRLAKLLGGEPFSYKETFATLVDKVIPVESDLSKQDLAMSQSDREMLEREVNIVFHCAASVKFDAPLKENMRDNVYATRSLVTLCNSMKKLDAFVHVSTAYSNCHLNQIEEGLIPVDRPFDEVCKIVDSLPNDVSEETTRKYLEGRPNTYTYTKALAENFVAKHEGRYPIAIVRPSIVVSSAEEPCPGWVDNINGISGLGCLAAIGVLRTIDWNYFAVSDMVPVDYVASCMMCAAYHVHENSPKKIQFYNMTTGNTNPVTWGHIFDRLFQKASETPPTKIVRPMIRPPKYKKVNPINFMLTKVFSELFFAYFIDMILSLIGYKKIMVKITQKMHNGYKILKPFTANEWQFNSDNVIQLTESLEADDKSKFKFDTRKLDWDELSDAIWVGSRRFILKEQATKESYEIGKSRAKLVGIVHYGMITLFSVLALFLSYLSTTRMAQLLF